jgi:hypothetical protein
VATETRIGLHVIAITDRNEDLAMIQVALDECEVMHRVIGERLEDTLGRDFRIYVKDSDYFRARGWVFTDGVLKGGVNAGRVHSGDLYVNSDMSRRLQKHITRHECAHVVPLSAAKRAELMQLMWTKRGKHPTDWTPEDKPYEASPEECHADTLAEAISGIDSPWDDWALYSLDVREEDHRRLMKVTFR